MKRQIKARLEGLLLGTFLATAVCLTAYNAEPIGRWLKQTYNKETLSQIGADLTRASEINKSLNMYQ